MKKQKNNVIGNNIPKKVKYILETLKKADYEAYIVGGCVRDVIMRKEPKDWDITTNAKPNEIQSLFEHTIETGKAFGTITVINEGMFCEVTTFRGESDYEDYRHPNKVWFSNQLEEDLKRRDFTVNAMACDEYGTLVDLFSGKKDIEKRILRCVGEPKERFQEDPLRMLRAVRFAVSCGFDIEHNTEQAMIQEATLLKYVSMERCRDELIKMLESDALDAIELLYHYQLLSVLFVGFTNFKENHCLERLKHAKTVEESLVVLLRNLVFDTQKASAEQHYKKQLRYLKFPEVDILRIAKAAGCQYNETYHDIVMVRRALAKNGVEAFRLAARVWQLEDETHNILHSIDTIINNNECISIQQLAVNGRDLIKIGFQQNRQLGETLNELLDIVLEEPKKNKKEQLLMIAKQIKQKYKNKSIKE